MYMSDVKRNLTQQTAVKFSFNMKHDFSYSNYLKVSITPFKNKFKRHLIIELETVYFY